MKHRTVLILFFVLFTLFLFQIIFFVNSSSVQPNPFEVEASQTNTAPNLLTLQDFAYNKWNINDMIEIDGNKEYITDHAKYDNNTALVTTDKSIYVLYAEKWHKIARTGIKNYAYFTSGEIAVVENEIYIFIGTSYNGLYYKNIKAQAFKHISQGLKRVFFTSSGSQYFETISELFVNNTILYIGYKSSKGINALPLDFIINKGIPQPIDMNIVLNDPVNENIEKMYNDSTNIYALTNAATYKLNKGNVWESVYVADKQAMLPDSQIRGLYISCFAANSIKKIDSLVKLATEVGLNAFVVDFKDDFGFLSYGSELPMSKNMHSSRRMIKIDYLMQKAKENNIKIIARVVTFKDPIAYEYENNKFALWDTEKNQPWVGLKKEKWIDPYNTEYHDYLVSIAKEIETLGVSEIQFDYVRFPSDGGISTIKARYSKGESKNIILYKFLQKVKQTVVIPVSVDFYGYQCWYKISNHIGQDIALISDVVDAIYPMYYPSHFTAGFYTHNIDQKESNVNLYHHGTLRAYDNSNYKIEIRPWIQVFSMQVKIPIKDYIKAQIEGIQKAGINSYIFWNPATRYDVLYSVFEK